MNTAPILRFRAISMDSPAYQGCMIRVKDRGIKMFCRTGPFGREVILVKRADASVQFSIDPHACLSGKVTDATEAQAAIVRDLIEASVLTAVSA